MSTETIQNLYPPQQQTLGRAALELTREESFLNGSHDVFDILEKKSRANTVLPMPQEAADLLKMAYQMIEKAESTISNQNERIRTLEGLLTTDELTGLTNRRGFFDAFRREIDRTNRGENEGGLLIMIDLDNFKAINDTHGHQAGDEALKLVGNFLAREIRNMDVAARLGGDEFIVLFPNTNKAKALRRAQVLRKKLNELCFSFGGTYIKVGGSLGLQDYKSGDTIDTIVHEADLRLYDDKKNRKKDKNV